MRSRTLFSLLLLCLTILVGCAGTGPDLRGAWVLVQTAGRDLPVGEEPGPADVVKVLSDHEFTFAWQDGDRFGGGAGTWEYHDGVYTESIRIHSHRDLVGETVAFKCELDGDLWHHTAQFMAKGRFYNIDEIWRRLRPHRRTDGSR